MLMTEGEGLSQISHHSQSEDQSPDAAVKNLSAVLDVCRELKLRNASSAKSDDSRQYLTMLIDPEADYLSGRWAEKANLSIRYSRHTNCQRTDLDECRTDGEGSAAFVFEWRVDLAMLPDRMAAVWRTVWHLLWGSVRLFKVQQNLQFLIFSAIYGPKRANTTGEAVILKEVTAFLR